jgi:hypothetical protein
MAITDGQVLIGERRSIDRTGLEKIARRLLFSSYSAATGAAYDEVGETYQDALFVGATGTGDEAGNWVCVFNYEKVVDSSDDDPENDIGMVEELDFSMKQDPISSHPNFATLIKTYGWDSSEKQFNKTLPDGTTDSPVYGTVDYLAFSCVYRQTQTLSEIPPEIFQNIGTLIEDPPFVNLTDPAANDERTWLYLAPKITTRGNAFTVTQEWMLSGFGTGWIEAIYSQEALNALDTSDN